MKKAILLLFSASLFAQNAQTPSAGTPYATPAPIFSANAKYVQGVGIGYWPTAGTGLNVKLAAGHSRCGTTMVNYAGGTVALADNATNYVFLDATASCAPGSNTSGYTSSLISVATVVTSSGVIVSLTDDRTMGMSSSTGTAPGTVTSFSAGNLSPVFTTSVANATSTPALSFSLSTAAAHAFLGNNTGSTGLPAYVQPNFTDLAGNIAVSQMNNGTSASSSTYWRGDGTWQPFTLTTAQKYRTCAIIVGSDDGSALVNSNLGPQGRLCFIPAPATIVEVDVAADAGTPNVIVGSNYNGTALNLVSGALATAAAGGVACSNTGGTTGIDGVTTCSATLQNTTISNGGTYLGLVSGTAGGTAKRMSIFVTWTVN